MHAPVRKKISKEFDMTNCFLENRWVADENTNAILQR